MVFSKTAKISAGFKMALGALAAGLVLRVIVMLFFYDYDTGFYTDGGLTAWLSLLLPGLAAGGAAWLFCRTGQSYGRYVRKKHGLPAILAFLSGFVLLQEAVRQAMDFQSFLKTGLSQYDAAMQPLIFWFFVAASLVFGLVQLVVGAALTTGRNPFRGAPLLYMAGVLWGISYLIVVYVFYAKSSCFVENFFSVVGAAALLVALLYACKLCSGVDDAGAAQRLFAAGGFLLAWEIPYLAANLLTRLLGKSYSGEQPAGYQLSALCAAAFLGVFLWTAYRDSREVWETEPPAEPEAQEPPADPEEA